MFGGSSDCASITVSTEAVETLLSLIVIISSGPQLEVSNNQAMQSIPKEAKRTIEILGGSPSLAGMGNKTTKFLHLLCDEAHHRDLKAFPRGRGTAV